MRCTDPQGCTLDPPVLAERIREWRAVSARATSREVGPGRLTSVYPSDPDVLARLRRLIEAERECCSFLRFTVREGAAETSVELEFPPEAQALIEDVVAPPLSGPHLYCGANPLATPSSRSR